MCMGTSLTEVVSSANETATLPELVSGGDRGAASYS
jgi:hypothetical protein